MNFPQVSIRFSGRHHRFHDGELCHFTTASSWHAIEQSGVLKATSENIVKHLKSPQYRHRYAPLEQTGVFTVDGDNFVRHWMREGSPYPDGTVSSGDYHLRRFTRRVAQEFSQRDGHGFDAMKAPWSVVCGFLKSYAEEPALAVVAVSGDFDDGEVLVRDHSFMYNQQPPPLDRNYDERFAALLDSVRTVEEWEHESPQDDHSWEFIFPGDVRLEDVRLKKMLSVDEVLSMFESKTGDKDKPDVARVRKLLLDA